MSVAVFAAVLTFAFFGSPHGETSFAVAVTWNIWWVLLPFSALVLGRAWCSICPISTISVTMLGFRKKPRRNERKEGLEGGPWASALVLLILSWAMIVWRIDEMPRATGVLLLVFLIGALAAGLLLEERAWCKSICPIGTIIGLYSRLAPLQLRPSATTCAARCERAGKCHAALSSAHCLLDGPVSALQSNRSCNLCGDCLKSCRHSSLGLRFSWPEALRARASAVTVGEVAVLMILFALVLLDLLRMTPWYPSLMKWLVPAVPGGAYNLALGLVILGLAASLATLYGLVTWVCTAMAKQDLLNSLVALASPYVALAAAVHLGSEVFHLVSHGTRPLLAMALDLGFRVDFPAVVRGAIYMQDSTLQAIDATLLLIALILGGRAFWQISALAPVGKLRFAVSAGVPAALSALIAGAAMFLFSSPMGMIH